MKKVILGMSGGVDSSVSAYLLKKQGYHVLGVSLLLFETRGRINPRTCCSLEAVNAARESAEIIDIPHKTINARKEFMEMVIEPFVKGYLKGITPNPCILCNKFIKFPILEDVARTEGAEFIATGHYAKVLRIDDRVNLAKATDTAKDQSYFLYVLPLWMLEHCLFPLGYYLKDDVRHIARELSLPSANRLESVEICFTGEKGYSGFIKTIEPEAQRPGPIYDINGNQIGTHKGIFNYTIGQRRGINVPSTEALYVIKIKPEENAIYVGPRQEAFKKRVYVEDVHWLAEPVERITARIRSMMKDEPARLVKTGPASCFIEFDEPQWAPAPGQAAVFYKHDIVIGGGTIVEEPSDEMDP
ncbi:MAG: tRNA 2-thiouridine(34) synthase MnmA [Nitrospirae bacterium]|nr:tRNA 2-thiouridine(34) synthase MnmA [Nitrospirota bacterium]